FYSSTTFLCRIYISDRSIAYSLLRLLDRIRIPLAKIIVETMNVSLTPELEQFIQSQVESGKYSSSEEVILAAIKQLEVRENIYKGRFEELQRSIMIGVEASERGELIDSEIVFQQLQQKLQQRREQAS
ncbi:type II toxin-antitoxin system ParD family antitoxin, partial [Nostoc sp. ChiQUE01b]|uniref:type II toxin-antitoxin system ParD family antitoxin n=1 Tax=Nostoc sp. ChiQUE01b TaxID=3075376 RepID=UPI002AD37A41